MKIYMIIHCSYNQIYPVKAVYNKLEAVDYCYQHTDCDYAVLYNSDWESNISREYVLSNRG